MINTLYSIFIKPRTQHPELVRKEWMLNVLLFGVHVMIMVSFVFLAANYVFNPANNNGMSLSLFILFTSPFVFAYLLSRIGHIQLASVIFIWILLFAAAFGSYKWGTLLPISLILYVIVIAISGALFSSKVSLILTFFISVFLLVLSHFQFNGVLDYNSSWFSDKYDVGDSVTVALAMVVVALISWMSNKEIERSLERALQSEANLKSERDMLEIRVGERTEELQKVQFDKLVQINKFADVGRLSSGLFHDLVNLLMSLSLNLENIQNQTAQIDEKHQLYNFKVQLSGSLNYVRKIEGFLSSVRKYAYEQDVVGSFSPAQEIDRVVDILHHKSIQVNTKIQHNVLSNLTISGSSVKFFQLVKNLVSNALDSYENYLFPMGKEKVVLINQTLDEDKMLLWVTDFGCGISEENKKHIFSPLFTTKTADKGSGLGLLFCKDIVEKDFSGRIWVDSSEGVSTTFYVEIPITKPSE